MEKVKRLLVLFIGALVTALSAATASLFTLNLSLNQNDLAKKDSVFKIWGPIEKDFAVPILLIGGAIGFLFAIKVLENTNLVKSLPVVFISTTLTAFLSGPLGLFSPILVLIVAILSIIVCGKKYGT